MDALESGFPTLGEIVSYLFQKTGLLASGDQFDEKREVKSFQTKLRRLSEEEGDIHRNLSDSLKTLIECLKNLGISHKQTLAIEGSLADIFGQYLHLVREEGTHLSKAGSIKWLIYTRLIDRICMCLHKYPYLLNIQVNPEHYPGDNTWYLPHFECGKISQWPMKTALQWAYDRLDVTRTRFHYPDKDTKAEVDFRLDQNLKNATRWITGKRSRSWTQVQENILESFRALESCSLPEYRRILSSRERHVILRVIFIARFSTEICLDIKKQYGEEFLIRCVELFRCLTDGLKEHDHKIEHIANQRIIKTQPKLTPEINAIWYHATKIYWKLDAVTQTAWVKEKEQYIKEYGATHGLREPFPSDVVASWRKEVGNYNVDVLIHALGFDEVEIPTVQFMDDFDEFYSIKNSDDLTLERISVYQHQLEKNGNYNSLSWMHFWLLGIYHYRIEEYKKSKEYVKKAFQLAKYIAGNRQYGLVNFYIELCAKNSRRKEFDLGVAWAEYLGIKVRWIRDRYDDPEAIEAAYTVLKTAVYPI